MNRSITEKTSLVANPTDSEKPPFEQPPNPPVLPDRSIALPQQVPRDWYTDLRNTLQHRVALSFEFGSRFPFRILIALRHSISNHRQQLRVVNSSSEIPV